MESSWDLAFACKTNIINKYIASQKIPFISNLEYQSASGKLCASIPFFSIGWSGNEQYMALKLVLKNVEISAAGITEKHEEIKAIVHLQFGFKNKEEISFICTTEASKKWDSQNGAIWIEEADLESRIENEILRDVFPSFLVKALIQNSDQINFVLAKLNYDFFDIRGIEILKKVPSFQKLEGECVLAVLCMTSKIGNEPPRYFSPQLLLEYDYGYIFRRQVFLKHLLLPNIGSVLEIEKGKFKLEGQDSIVNDGRIQLKTIKVSATSYVIKATMIKIQLIGDNLHVQIEGKSDITGLTDSYVSYGFHAVRKGHFEKLNSEEKIVFKALPETPDEFYSSKHIPLWIEITAGIFTLGLFSLISECISDEIRGKIAENLKEIQYNGQDGGYSIEWKGLDTSFCDGGFEENFYMRGRIGK